jgi:hypothetical protein
MPRLFVASLRALFFASSAVAAIVFAPSVSFAQEVAKPALSAPKPAPLMQAEPLPHHQVRLLKGDRELTRFHFDPTDRRPFLYPIIGPSGRSLVRMGHPHDPISHSHHNGVWISHHIVDGINFWGDVDKKLGRITTKYVEQLDDTDASASFTSLQNWTPDEPVGRPIMAERRRIEVRPIAGDDYLIIIDLEFTALDKDRTIEKTPFGVIGVRMRKSIGVNDGGGRVLNSEGAINEKGIAGDGVNPVHWKPARWCDYAGPVTATASEGITLFDHPMNPNHPTVFHVRNDGWMGACLTFDAPRTLEPGKPLRLRYGLFVHDKLLDAPAIDAQWRAFTKLPSLATLVKPKPAKK